MRMFRIVSGSVSLGVGVYLFVWGLLAFWYGFSDAHGRTALTLWSGGAELEGWPVWLILGGVALVGVFFGWFGIYVLRFRRPTA